MHSNSASKALQWKSTEQDKNNFLPEHTLLVEILMQAIRDIINVNQGKRCGEKQYRRAALFWIDSENETSENGKFTFIQICQELNLDYQQVRSVIKRKLREQDPNFHLIITRSTPESVQIRHRRRVMKT